MNNPLPLGTERKRDVVFGDMQVIVLLSQKVQGLEVLS